MLSSEGPGPRLQIDSDASEDSDVDMGVSEDEQPAVVDYERLRAERIASNLQRMAAMGLPAAAQQLTAMTGNGTKRPAAKRAPKEKRERTRSSRRLVGAEAEFEGLKGSDDEALEDLLAGEGRRVKHKPALFPEAAEAQRCSSLARGGEYSQAGVTCHFCRQKKLCGEPDCERCQTKDPALECAGKSACSRCHSGTGFFCRACLDVRYGLKLEDVKAAMASADGWLCPHCYEEENPTAGLFCNSSICMRKSGRVPTGIAIFRAQALGFKSVAHLLQAQWLAKNGANASAAAAAWGLSGAAKSGAAPRRKPADSEPITSDDASDASEDGSREDAAPATPPPAGGNGRRAAGSTPTSAPPQTRRDAPATAGGSGERGSRGNGIGASTSSDRQLNVASKPAGNAPQPKRRAPSKPAAKAPPKRKAAAKNGWYYIEQVKDHKDVVTEDGTPLRLYLIKWEGCSEAENSWEPARNMADSRAVLREYWAGRNEAEA